MKHSVVGISDVSIGYGSPEVPALMDSICSMLDLQGLLIEPDEIARPPIKLNWMPKFELKRITSKFPDHSPTWHRHFQASALREIERNDPEIVVIFGSAVFSSLTGLNRWPKKLIYHAYEAISGLSDHDLNAHHCLLEQCDLVITPEVERLIVDCEKVKAWPKSVAAIYNVADVSYPSEIRKLPADQRNGRFLWFGTLNRAQAFADYFILDEVNEFEFDIFGRITDPNADDVARKMSLTPNLRYFGVVSAEELNQRRAENTFSLVWWNPDLGPGAYYLASNRFFTSIQAGVPPICGPHPQCIELVGRYGCGLIMKDWSVKSFVDTLQLAREIYNTPTYAQMVENCAFAAQDKFNWPAQFERIKPQIANVWKSEKR